MATTLSNCEVLLSKEISDYWSSTTTSGGSSTTLIDTALMAKANDWIDGDPGEMYDHITSGTYNGEERKISSLANSTGTLTTLAHGGTIATAVTYRVHRVFSASDKRIALIEACKDAFPSIFAKIFDETKTLGNWLRNGGVSEWAVATYPDYWRVSGVTATETTTAPYYKRAKSVKLDTATGYLYQDLALCPHFARLPGNSVTLTAQAWCDTASALRLGILYDGTNLTYSDYHDGDSAWTKDNDPLSVTYTIDDNPTNVSFRVYYANAAATAYVSDLRVYSRIRNMVYVGDLGLAQNIPHGVFVESTDYSQYEPWIRMTNYTVDKDGWMHLPSDYSDYRLRIEGIGYLDFLVSGASSTAWTATVDIDSPQIKILVAQAIVWLCRQMISPNFTSDHNAQWNHFRQDWQRELAERKAKFGLIPPPATGNYGV